MRVPPPHFVEASKSGWVDLQETSEEKLHWVDFQARIAKDPEQILR